MKFEWLSIQCAVENKYVSWNSAFNRWVSNEIREKIHRNWNKGEDVNYTWPIATQRQKRTMPQNQLNSANHVVSLLAGSIQCEFAMIAYNETLFYISYSLCLAFRLCSSMIIFYTSLEVIKLAFLEDKSRYACCIFPTSIFPFETKNLSMFEKIRLCVADPISNFFFLVFLLSSWTRNWKCI